MVTINKDEDNNYKFVVDNDKGETLLEGFGYASSMEIIDWFGKLRSEISDTTRFKVSN